MARKIIWTKKANQSFNNVIAYLEKEWGEKVTREFVAKSYGLIDAAGNWYS